MMVKMMGVPILIATSYFAVTQAQDFLSLTLGVSGGERVVQTVNANTSIGGSAFQASGSLAVRLALSPLFLVRPFPWEAHNVQALIAATEGLFILYLLLRHRRSLLRSLVGWRTRPFATFLLLYSSMFVLGYGASILNFGILTRMRIMVLSTLILLMCSGEGEASRSEGPLRPATAPRWRTRLAARTS